MKFLRDIFKNKKVEHPDYQTQMLLLDLENSRLCHEVHLNKQKIFILENLIHESGSATQ